MKQQKVGLVLSGGGARGAYQAGLMKALVEISQQGSASLPISIITGVSAGAINAAHLASTWNDPIESTKALAQLWSILESENIFRTDAASIGHIAARWVADTAFGSLRKTKKARSLLDTAPLQELITKQIDFTKIKERIKEGCLEALGITAMDYASSTSVTFVQGHENVQPWDRSRRKSVLCEMTPEHVMGSSALPLFFPPIQVGASAYGDGALRNMAPLSPAIHLGADKLIVVGVRKADDPNVEPPKLYEATIARVVGVIMNAILLDCVEVDMERMIRINNTLRNVPESHRGTLTLRPIEYLWLRPSQDIGLMASGHFEKLPSLLRYLVGGLGSAKESSELTSYLLFDPEYCGKLVELGYNDGWAQQDEIKAFLQPA
jgi:NTE family protein